MKKWGGLGRLAVLTAACVPFAGGASAQAGTVTFTYSTGEHRIVIPSGVSKLHIVAVGGRGGNGYPAGPGGRGAQVTGDLSVSTGAVYYLLAAGNGANGNEYGSEAGGGGGASDIRRLPASSGLGSDTRLLIAAGGGGAGRGFGCTDVCDTGGGGGDAGTRGHKSSYGTEGGSAGVPAGDGAGGCGLFCGGAGSLGFGGAGAGYGAKTAGGFNGGAVAEDSDTNVTAGGGGGGGRFGGGGGGAGSVAEYSEAEPGGGGGGGGSNLLPAGATAAIDTSGKPGITISYTDLAAPLVSLDQPPAASRNAVPVLTGTGGTQLGDGNVSVRVYAGSSTGGTLVQTLTATPDAATGRYSVAASPALADGTYTAVASQSDAAGNASTSLLPRTFRIDTTAPAVSLTAPASTADTTPTLTGTAEPRAVTVDVYAGAGATGAPIRTLTTTPNATGAYSVTVNTVLLTPLLPGTYTARASQTDAVGNVGSSAARTFTVDVTAPSVSLTAPSAQVADTTPRFSGVGGIAAGDSATVTVRVYAGAAATGTPLQTLNASRSATTGAYAVDASTALAQGQYTAVASQSDAAGNGGKSAARTFIVDTIAPVVTLTTAEPYIAVPNVPQFRGVGGRVAGDSSTVTIRVYAGASATGTPVNTASAGRSPTDGRYFAQGLPLVTGTYTAVTSQSDAAGNVGKSTSRTFSINGIL